MILTLNIQLLFGIYTEDGWKATIEIDSSSTLEDLHLAIQDAVKFDNDHLYEFYISRTERGRDRIRFDDENEGIFNTTLGELFPLEKGKKLFYMFDYGDSWLFKVSKQRLAPKKPRQYVKYPCVVSEDGFRPEQYPPYEDAET